MTAQSTRVVHRYPLPIQDEVTFALPDTARVVHVAPCRERPDLVVDVWFEVSAARERMYTRKLYFEGTGHPIAPDTEHVGSVVCPNGLVWHLYLATLRGPV